jgi:hypothetical protein
MEPFSLLSSLDAELSARSDWLPNIYSLDFVNDPTKWGPYKRTTDLDQPNVGPHALKTTRKNYIFLEYENRLCDILSILKSMDDTEARDDMEDRVIQELVRIERLKEIEWSGQRSKRGIKGRGAIVNTGMHLSSPILWRLLYCNQVVCCAMNHLLYVIMKCCVFSKRLRVRPKAIRFVRRTRNE